MEHLQSFFFFTAYLITLSFIFAIPFRWTVTILFHIFIAAELLEETRAKCRVLESEVERRQLEAQDGWSAAAHLQQYFRNLHNILKGSSEQDEEFTDEPSALAELVRSSIVSLNNEYQELRETNAKNKDLISLLTRKTQFSNKSSACLLF